MSRAGVYLFSWDSDLPGVIGTVTWKIALLGERSIGFFLTVFDHPKKSKLFPKDCQLLHGEMESISGPIFLDGVQAFYLQDCSLKIEVSSRSRQTFFSPTLGAKGRLFWGKMILWAVFQTILGDIKTWLGLPRVSGMQQGLLLERFPTGPYSATGLKGIRCSGKPSKSSSS